MSVDHPGFADPVQDSQACFRAVLDAMSRPGMVQRVTGPADPPPPLGRAMAGVLLTLVDAETPVWLDAGVSEAADWVAFHCGAPLVPIAAASIVCARAPVALAALRAGSDDEPEGGATLVLEVAGFGRGTPLLLDGPGLAAPKVLEVEGLPAGFVADWASNRARFPRGVDLLLCAGDALVAFPRRLAVTNAIREG